MNFESKTLTCKIDNFIVSDGFITVPFTFVTKDNKETTLTYSTGMTMYEMSVEYKGKEEANKLFAGFLANFVRTKMVTALTMQPRDILDVNSEIVAFFNTAEFINWADQQLTAIN